MIKYTNVEILEMLQSSIRKKEDAALAYLHRQLYDLNNQFVLKHGGTKEDAEDVMQEALVAFFKLARTHKTPETLNVEAYVYTICKNKWYRKAKKKPLIDELSEDQSQIPDEDIQIKATIEDEKSYLLNILQNRIGKVCYQLLVHFYYEGRKMKEIVQLLSFSNEQVAKNKKSKCMKSLKNLMKEEPGFKKAFQ